MTKKRHEILGRNLFSPLENLLANIERRFAEFPETIAPGQPNQSDKRHSHLESCVSLALLDHLGYGPIENLDGQLNYGMDWAVDYFFSDWDRDERKRPGDEPNFPYGTFYATEHLTNVLLLGGLTGRWDDVAKICAWFNSNIDLDTQGEMIAHRPEKYLSLGIASNLSPTPLPGVDAAVARLKVNGESYNEWARLLCTLWEAAVARDQTAFDKALKARLSYFLKKEAENVPNVAFWVDKYTSAIWFIAERNGLAFPKLREKQDAALVRRQTVGLA